MCDLVKISRWCAKYGRKKMRLGQDSWLNHRDDIYSHTYLECLRVSKKENVQNMERHLFVSGKLAACNYIKKNIYAYNKEINLSEFFLRTLVDERQKSEYSPEWRMLYVNLKKFTPLTRKQKKGRAVAAADRDAKILALGLTGASYSHIALFTGIPRRNVKDYYSLAIKRVVSALKSQSNDV